jgi:hypothetical protein
MAEIIIVMWFVVAVVIYIAGAVVTYYTIKRCERNKNSM